MPGFRPNVALLMLDREDRLLICEREGCEGAWQFPQGGVDPGESVEEAMAREVWEEVGLPADSYEVLRSHGGYRYVFPEKVRKRKKGDWEGQEQTYFLCRLGENPPPINIDQEPREFRDYRWIKPEEFRLKWLPKWKREVYRAVLEEFFGVEPE